ncbi:hypothetical protein B0H11DRAFT_2215785 [Mycena galericulata]|nr:hypothetical protein B0H11DRAFT_2215785 [Mycena galericulata]
MLGHQPSLQPESGDAQSQASYLEEQCRDAIHKLWILILAQRNLLRVWNNTVSGAREAMRSANLLRRRAEAMAQIAARYEKARTAWRALE